MTRTKPLIVDGAVALLLASLLATTSAQAGDYARAAEINQEAQANSEEYQRVMAEGGAQARLNAQLEASSRDRQMTVSARIKSGSESGNGGEAMAMPEGTSAAYLWRTENNLAQVNALVLLGEWAPAEYGVQPVPRTGAGATAAHAISVRFEADIDRIASAVDATEFNSLAGLLNDQGSRRGGFGTLDVTPAQGSNRPGKATIGAQ